MNRPAIWIMRMPNRWLLCFLNCIVRKQSADHCHSYARNLHANSNNVLKSATAACFKNYDFAQRKVSLLSYGSNTSTSLKPMILRSLKYFWRIHLAVIAGAAVTTAVLTGALLVGDSVRGSLQESCFRTAWKNRLRSCFRKFFRENLSGELNGFAVHYSIGNCCSQNTGARATGITVHGIDNRMNVFYDETMPSLKSFQNSQAKFFSPW